MQTQALRLSVHLVEQQPTASSMGKKGGASKSPRKQAAARLNGKKGGRKKKNQTP